MSEREYTERALAWALYDAWACMWLAIGWLHVHRIDGTPSPLEFALDWQVRLGSAMRDVREQRAALARLDRLAQPQPTEEASAIASGQVEERIASEDVYAWARLP